MPENAAQKYFDRLTAVEPIGTEHTGNKYADIGINALSNMGAGLIGLGTPIFHPLQTADAITHPVRTLGALQQGFNEHPWETGEQTLGGLIGGYGLSEAVEPLRAIKPFSESSLPPSPGSVNLRVFVPPAVEPPPPLRIPRMTPLGEAPQLVPPQFPLSDWKNPYFNSSLPAEMDAPQFPPRAPVPVYQPNVTPAPPAPDWTVELPKKEIK